MPRGSLPRGFQVMLIEGRSHQDRVRLNLGLVRWRLARAVMMCSTDLFCERLKNWMLLD